jgi:integrase
MKAGTIEETKSGRFSVRLPRALDKNRRRLGTYDTRDEAQSIVNGTLALAQKHHITIPGGETLRSFLADFLNRRELNGVRNIDRDRRTAKSHLETAEFVDAPLTSIRRVQVADWLDRLQRKPSKRTGEKLKAQTVRNTLNLLRVCFQEAMDRGLIEQNPARDLRLNRSTNAVTEEPWTYLEPEEQKAFLGAMPADEGRYYAFALGTGLRPGEQRALQLSDVRLDGEDAYVLVRQGNPGKPTKTGKTRRVPLFGMALEAAHVQVAFLKGKANPKRIFWPTPTGNHRPEGSPDGWADWLRAAGIKRPVRVYDLRHSCASSLVAGWWGRRWFIEEVKEVLGHSDIKMTQRYAHLGDTALRAATRETNEAYFGPQLAQKEAQPPEMSGKVTVFVNRRSRVRLSQLAPERTRENDANSGFSVDQMWTSKADGPSAIQWDGDRLRGLAEVYLRAVAIGAPANELAETLANAVLGSELVRLAEAVLGATEFRIARATELAAKILDAASSVATEAKTEGRHG